MGKGNIAGYIYKDHTDLKIAPIKSIQKNSWLQVDHPQHIVKFYIILLIYLV